MTQEDYDTLKSLKSEQEALDQAYEEVTKNYKDMRKNLIPEQRKIHERCDHKYPNGDNAWQGYFMYSMCDICGYCDL